MDKTTITNKSRLFGLALFIVVFIGLLGSFSMADAATTTEKLNELYNQQSKNNESIEENEEAAEQKKAEAVDLSNSIDRIESDITETQSKINSIDSQISSTQSEIDQTTEQIEQKQAELETENQKRKETIVELYETGRKSFWEILISAENISEAVNHNHYFEVIEARLEESIKKISLIKTELEGKKTDLDNKKGELAALKGEQAAYRQSLQLQKNEKDIVLADTQAQQKKFEDQVAEAKKYNKQVEAQIASIQASIRNSQNGSGGVAPRDRGTSAVGFSWPMNYRYITCYYGESTPFQSFHTGLDMTNVMGTPVYAASDGTVITVRDTMLNGSYYGYGKYVVIGHNARYSSLYAHLMSYTVSPGQEVSRGDVIGYMGNTGWSTGPHLHFEVWDNGNRVNPISYLP